MGRPFPYGAHRVAEIPDGLHGEPFHNTAAGEAQESGMNIPELFRQVFPQAVAHKSLFRHKGHKTEPDRRFLRAADDKFRTAGGFLSGKYRVIPAPVSGPDHNLRGRGNLPLFFNAQRQQSFPFGFCKHIKAVCLALFLGNAAETNVPDAAARTKIHPQGYFPFRVQRILRIRDHLRPVSIPGRHRRRYHSVVLYPLGHSFPVVELLNPAGGRYECFAAVLRIGEGFGIAVALDGPRDAGHQMAQLVGKGVEQNVAVLVNTDVLDVAHAGGVSQKDSKKARVDFISRHADHVAVFVGDCF